jgi:hypothetical protein
VILEQFCIADVTAQGVDRLVARLIHHFERVIRLCIPLVNTSKISRSTIANLFTCQFSSLSYHHPSRPSHSTRKGRASDPSCLQAARFDEGRPANALLCRVGADQSLGGGSWNGLVDTTTGKFVYVPIPEGRLVHAGLEKPYGALGPVISKFGGVLPPHLQPRHMHLDPDFDYLTYGDQGERAKQLRANLDWG